MISAAFKEKIIYVRLSVVKNVNLVLSTVLPILKMNPLKSLWKRIFAVGFRL